MKLVWSFLLLAVSKTVGAYYYEKGKWSDQIIALYYTLDITKFFSSSIYPLPWHHLILLPVGRSGHGTPIFLRPCLSFSEIRIDLHIYFCSLLQNREFVYWKTYLWLNENRNYFPIYVVLWNKMAKQHTGMCFPWPVVSHCLSRSYRYFHPKNWYIFLSSSGNCGERENLKGEENKGLG